MVFYLQGSDKERDKVIIDKGDDPYFYDAYQGIKEVDIQERKQIVANLNQKIEAKVKANRKIGLPFLKVAASLAILAGLSFWIFNFSQSKRQVVFSPGKSNDNKVALQKETISDINESSATELIASKSEQVVAADANTAIVNPNTPPAVDPFAHNGNTAELIVSAPPAASSGFAQGAPPATIQQQDSDPIIRYESPGTRIFYENPQQTGGQTDIPRATNPPSSNTSIGDVASASSSGPTKTTTNQPQSSADAMQAREDIIGKIDQAESARQTTRKKKRNNKLVGYVKDQYGNSIFGVTVIAEESMNGTSTDMDGKFELEGLIRGEPLVFKSIGYEDVNQKYDGTSTLKINLKNTAELSEVAVTSPAEEEQIMSKNEGGANGFLSNQSNQNLKFAKPASGWKTFKSIVEKNKRYPSEAIENDISGRVIISFFVDANGQLSDFQVKKSLGYGCDEEAIRLLKNGPPWDAGATNTRAEYTFRFK